MKQRIKVIIFIIFLICIFRITFVLINDKNIYHETKKEVGGVITYINKDEDKTTFDMVQKRKEKNLKNFHRKLVYIFMQKMKCPKCGKIMGGSSSTSKNKTKHI